MTYMKIQLYTIKFGNNQKSCILSRIAAMSQFNDQIAARFEKYTHVMVTYLWSRQTMQLKLELVFFQISMPWANWEFFEI